jgi:hypothetical protein
VPRSYSLAQVVSREIRELEARLRADPLYARIESLRKMLADYEALPAGAAPPADATAEGGPPADLSDEELATVYSNLKGEGSPATPLPGTGRRSRRGMGPPRVAGDGADGASAR